MAKLSLSETPLGLKLTLLWGSTLTVMAGAMIAPALPMIRDAFVSSGEVEVLSRLVLTLPSLFIVIFAPLAGLVSDRIGRKALLLVATVVYVLAGVGGYFAPSLTLLLVTRAALGAAAGCVMTIITTLIGDYFVPAQRGKVMGLQAVAMGLAGVTCQLAGGWLAEYGWRVPFLLYLTAGLLPLAVLRFIHEPSKQRGAAKQVTRDTEPARSSRHIVLPLYAVALVGSLAFFVVPTQLPFHLTSMGINEPSRAGMAIATMTVGSIVASAAYARTRGRWRPRHVTAAALMGMALGYALVPSMNSWRVLLIAMLIAGMGKGLLIPHIQAVIVNTTPAVLRGRIVGGLMSVFFLGQFLSPLITQPIGAALGTGSIFTVTTVVLATSAALYLLADRTIARPSTLNEAKT